MGRSYQPQGAQDGRMWSRRCDLYVPADMYCLFADIHLCVAGELPKELGKLVNLTALDLSDNEFQGELYVPVYLRCMFADISLFCRRIAQGARQPRQFDQAYPVQQSVPRRVVCSITHRCLSVDYSRLPA